MPEQIRIGKKPVHEGGKGGEEGEVGGRELIAITCWNCGVVNWVPSYWYYFVCRHCGLVNHSQEQ